MIAEGIDLGGRATEKLTASVLKSKSLRDGMLHDGRGLYLKVRGDSRSWLLRYTRDGRKREMGLGSAADVSLATARRLAAEAREQVAIGLDPIEERKKAADPRRRSSSSSVPLFGEAARRFIHNQSSGWRNAKHRAQWSSTIETYGVTLLDLPVDEISPEDVASALAPIWTEKIETANRVRGRIERILDAMIAVGARPAPNPAALSIQKHLLPARSKAQMRVKHHAAVPVREAPQAFQRLWEKRRDSMAAAALVTVALTAMRSGEARHLERSDLRLEGASGEGPYILIPADRMKAARDHSMPLTWALALHLAEIPRFAGTILVHPARTNRPLSDMALTMGMRRAGLGDYTPHGWRSTFRDWAALSGWDRLLAELQLAHTVGSKVEAAYFRDTLIERRRPVMEAWGKHLMTGL